MNTHSPNPSHEDMIRRNKRAGLMVLAVVLFMIGMSFAAVPLYSLFCRVTGFDGTTGVATALPGKILDRQITVKFNTDTGRNLGWSFKPELREVTVKLGDRGLIAFDAQNKTDKPAAGTALYNVTPLKAGKYFQKIQCFCFDEQILGPGEKVSMPVVFFVDPALNDDPNMEDVTTITLSYTFFPADSKELDAALEAFYNEQPPKAGDTNKKDIP